MLLIVDRAVEGDPAEWNELVAALASLTNSRNYEFAWSLKLFPEDGPGCGAGSVTNGSMSAFMFRNAATINAALSVATPTHDGTPTAAALEAGRAYLAVGRRHQSQVHDAGHRRRPDLRGNRGRARERSGAGSG